MIAPNAESATKVRAMVAAYRRHDEAAVGLLLNDLIDSAADAGALLLTLAEANADPLRRTLDATGSDFALAIRGGREVTPRDPQQAAMMLVVFAVQRDPLGGEMTAAFVCNDGQGFFVRVLDVLLHMVVDKAWIKAAFVSESGVN